MIEDRLDTPSKVENMSFHSFNSYYTQLYALIHGYDFKRVRVSEIPGRHPTWARLKALYHVLPHYDIVVHLDGDAFVTNLSTSIEFLMDRWNFTDATHFLQARAIGNRSHSNCGFWLIRNTALSRQKLLDLIECPDKIPGCEIWRTRFSHEQAAWNIYFRHTMKQGEEFIVVSENEANGWPDWGGKWITHGWGVKNQLKEWMSGEVVRQFLLLMQKFVNGNHSLPCSSWEKSHTSCD
jgi:hypothetical protein